jgi:thiamine biosynthesis lipoprotein
MGMPVTFDVRDDGIALDPAFEWLRWVDATFSTYRPDSEISRLNRGEIELHDLHPLVRHVLNRCEQLRHETDGAFDARAPRPGEIDPTGLVKGWALQRAVDALREAGARNLLADAGGDVIVQGTPSPAEQRWRVGIRHPRIHDRLAAVLELTDAAVATSGTYERGEHIVDPRTGAPPSGILSVTVVGPDLATADAYATAAFALGTDGPAWTATLRDHEAMTILATDRVLTTPGFTRLRAAM